MAFSNLVKSRSRAIGLKNDQMALEFDRRLRSITAEPAVKFQSHPTNSFIDLAASRLDETSILQLANISDRHL